MANIVAYRAWMLNFLLLNPAISIFSEVHKQLLSFSWVWLNRAIEQLNMESLQSRRIPGPVKIALGILHNIPLKLIWLNWITGKEKFPRWVISLYRWRWITWRKSAERKKRQVCTGGAGSGLISAVSFSCIHCSLFHPFTVISQRGQRVVGWAPTSSSLAWRRRRCLVLSYSSMSE